MTLSCPCCVSSIPAAKSKTTWINYQPIMGKTLNGPPQNPQHTSH